jgi:hypothetical protein
MCGPPVGPVRRSNGASPGTPVNSEGSSYILGSRSFIFFLFSHGTPLPQHDPFLMLPSLSRLCRSAVLFFEAGSTLSGYLRRPTGGNP